MSFHRPALAAALLLCIARPQLAGEPPLASITHVSSRCVSPWHASLKAHASIAESEEEGGALRRARSSTCRAPLSLRVRGGGVGGGDSAGESSGEFDPATLKIEDLADSDYWEEIGETARDSLRKAPLFPEEEEAQPEEQEGGNDQENLAGDREELWEGERDWKFLLRAARRNDADGAVLLLATGADPRRCNVGEDPLGRNALQLAACFAHKEVMEVLLASGGETGGKQGGRSGPRNDAGVSGAGGVHLVNSVSQYGCSALHFAAVLKDRAACQLLLDAGADIGLVDAYGDQAIDRAEVDEDAEMVEFLEAEMHARGVERVFGNRLFTEDEAMKIAEMAKMTRDPDYIPLFAKDADGRVSSEFLAARETLLQKRREMKRKGEIPRDYEELMRRASRANDEDKAWVEARFRKEQARPQER